MGLTKLRIYFWLLLVLLLPAVCFSDEIKYVTSASTGRVLAIQVDENPPITLPGEEIPEGGSVQAAAAKLEKKVAELSVTPAAFSSANTGSLKKPIPTPAPFEPDPVKIARDFLIQHGTAFGLKDPGIELSFKKKEEDSLGTTVTFAQRNGKVGDFGAELKVHVGPGPDFKVRSANGAVVAGATLDTRPRLREPHAIRLAKLYFGRDHRRFGKVDSSELKIFQPSLLENTNDPASYLTWEIRLTGAFADKTYLIDAGTGDLRRTFDNVRHLNRKVYDCSAQPGTDVCWSNLMVQAGDTQFGWPSPPGPASYLFGCRDANQSQPCPRQTPNPRYETEASGDTEFLYALIADVHEYYWTKFNRNGANGVGGNNNGAEAPLITSDMDAGRTYLDFASTWGPNCLDAAYFLSQGVAFCKDVVVPDVVGHEYAHGVNVNLVYAYESGSLDESHSEVIGEMFEYWMTSKNDWRNALSIYGDAALNFADPPTVFDRSTLKYYPDRYTSANMLCPYGFETGVDHNSTVPSKAMYLASMGGDFNGCSVSPITRERVEQVLYRAKTLYYTPSETFNGAYAELIQSCIDIYGAGTSDCTQIVRSLQAVEMNQANYCSGGPFYPATCQCTDTDDWKGEGIYSQQGMTNGAVSWNGRQYKDYCLMRRNVIEQFCQNGVRKQALIYCPNGCVNGACV